MKCLLAIFLLSEWALEIQLGPGNFHCAAMFTCFACSGDPGGLVVVADMGLPLVYPQILGMLVYFLPIVLVETLVCRVITGFPFRTWWRGLWRANLVSTLIGVPATWLGVFGVQIAIGLLTPAQTTPSDARLFRYALVNAAWLPPGPMFVSAFPIARCFLMAPFYIVSSWIEVRIVKRFLPDAPRQELTHAVWLANAVSYSMLTVLVLSRLAP